MGGLGAKCLEDQMFEIGTKIDQHGTYNIPCSSHRGCFSCEVNAESIPQTPSTLLALYLLGNTLHYYLFMFVDNSGECVLQL